MAHLKPNTPIHMNDVELEKYLLSAQAQFDCIRILNFDEALAFEFANGEVTCVYQLGSSYTKDVLEGLQTKYITYQGEQIVVLARYQPIIIKNNKEIIIEMADKVDSSSIDKAVDKLSEQQNIKSKNIDPTTGAFTHDFYEKATQKVLGKKWLFITITNYDTLNTTLSKTDLDKALTALSSLINIHLIQSDDLLIRYSPSTFLIQFSPENINNASNLLHNFMQVYPSEVKHYQLQQTPHLNVAFVVPNNIEDFIAAKAFRLFSTTTKVNNYIDIHVSDELDDTYINTEDARAILNESVNTQDVLTGLPTSNIFRKFVQDAIIHMDKDQPLYLLHFDIESFKTYNHKYGYMAGDKILCQLSSEIKNQFPCCYITRIGVDCFEVLTSEKCHEDKARAISNNIDSLKRGADFKLKCGVYKIKDSSVNAGIAMDKAKHACDSIKGIYNEFINVYDESLDDSLKLSKYVITNLAPALDKGYVQVHYQPIIRMLTGKICGYESLCRWIEPDKGVIPPCDFIPTLERAHLIDVLDRFMIKQVYEDNNTLKEEGYDLLTTSINLSRIDFQTGDIVKYIEHLDAQYNIDPKLIAIEITESCLHDNSQTFKEKLTSLRRLGHPIWMDDFGSGYSSLGLLKNYEFDTIKLDMSFITDIETNSRSRMIVSSYIDLAKSLGIQTLTEGVETPSQADTLSHMGCELLQGYLFSKPLPFEEVLNTSKYKRENSCYLTYYKEIGGINILHPEPKIFAPQFTNVNNAKQNIPLCLVEVQNDKFHLLTSNDVCKEMFEAYNIYSTEEFDEQINSPQTLEREVFLRVANWCTTHKESRTTRFYKNEVRYVLSVRLASSYKDRHTFIVAVVSANEPHRSFYGKTQ